MHTKFGSKPEAKRLFGRPRGRCEDTKLNLREIGLDGVEWTHVANDRLAPVSTEVNPLVP
jgi:hypothetical protein